MGSINGGSSLAYMDMDLRNTGDPGGRDLKIYRLAVYTKLESCLPAGRRIGGEDAY